MDINYKEILKTRNAHWLGVEAERFKFLEWIINHIDDELVLRIYDWKGERSTYYYSEGADNYCALCGRLWNRISIRDFGSSNTSHANYKFVSDIVVHLVDDNQILVLKMKKAKLEKLKKETEELEKEINNENR